MSQLRKDPVSGTWVIIAPERARRPMELDTARTLPANPDACPFCEGHESETTPEIFALREPDSVLDGPGWRLRVVSNMYPALKLEHTVEQQDAPMYKRLNGVGAHEVVIDSPRHVMSITSLSSEAVQDMLATYSRRLESLAKHDTLKYGLVFKNVGLSGGATIAHTHSQILATPMVPGQIAREMKHTGHYHEDTGKCLFCCMITQELETASRMVEENTRFVAFAPFASRFPFETIILPKEHAAHYTSLDAEAISELAVILQSVLARSEIALGVSAYNYLIHTAPFHCNEPAHYHWHMHLIPRANRMGGFEWGTGGYINTVPPEQAARFMRELSDSRLAMHQQNLVNSE